MITIEYEAYGDNGETLCSGEMTVDKKPETDEEISSVLNELFDNPLKQIDDLIAGIKMQ